MRGRLTFCPCPCRRRLASSPRLGRYGCDARSGHSHVRPCTSSCAVTARPRGSTADCPRRSDAASTNVRWCANPTARASEAFSCFPANCSTSACSSLRATRVCVPLHRLASPPPPPSESSCPLFLRRLSLPLSVHTVNGLADPQRVFDTTTSGPQRVFDTTSKGRGVRGTWRQRMVGHRFEARHSCFRPENCFCPVGRSAFPPLQYTHRRLRKRLWRRTGRRSARTSSESLSGRQEDVASPPVGGWKAT